MTRVNQSPEVLNIWKKQQRSSEDEEEGSMARLTDKNRLAGEYSLVLLFVWGLSMRVGVTIA